MKRVLAFAGLLVMSGLWLWCNQGEAPTPQDTYQNPGISMLYDGTEVQYDETIYAISACVMDASNERVLFGKNTKEQLPMASTTKIMTCLVALENCELDEIVTCSAYAASMPDVQLGLKKGEQYRLIDLLHSMMMESHNDSAVAVAEHVAGSEEAFCQMMTERAVAAGATHTSFETANGLDGDAHYTTAEDLARIGSIAVKNQKFVAITNTDTYKFSDVSGKRSFFLSNINRYLYMDSSAIGMKTGFTGKAGYCFVGATKYKDTVLVSVVLGSGWPPHKQYKWSDTKKLVTFARDNFETTRLAVEAGELGKLSVIDGIETEVRVGITEGFSEEILLAKENVTIEYIVSDFVTAPAKEGTVVGQCMVRINGEVYKKLDICTLEECRKTSLIYYWSKIETKFFP